MIIAATLIMVAAVANRIIKREKDRCWLNATRLAINEVIFNGLSLIKNNFIHLSFRILLP
jgi:hypothetical protein